jgi:hypothetical protein
MTRKSDIEGNRCRNCLLAATISRGIHGSQSRRIPGHTAGDETVGRLTALLDQAAVGTWALLPLLLLEDRSAFAALGRRPQKSGSESAMCAVPTTRSRLRLARLAFGFLLWPSMLRSCSLLWPGKHLPAQLVRVELGVLIHPESCFLRVAQ